MESTKEGKRCGLFICVWHTYQDRTVWHICAPINSFLHSRHLWSTSTQNQTEKNRGTQKQAF